MPAYLENYVVGNNNDLFDKNIVNFALFADCDPVAFEEVVKVIIGIKKMDEEMHAIEKK